MRKFVIGAVRSLMRTAFLVLAIVVLLSLPAEATGVGKIKAICVALLNELSITTNGVYTPPGGGWTDNGTTVTTTTATDGVGIGATPLAGDILRVEGNATRYAVRMTAGPGSDAELNGGSAVADGGEGGAVQLNGGAGNGTTGDGGLIWLRSGDGGATSGAGGVINFTGGAGSGAFAGGAMAFTAGTGGATGAGGGIDMVAGNGGATSGAGGQFAVASGNGSGASPGGPFQVIAGNGGATGNGADLDFRAGNGGGTSGNGGNLIMQSGGATDGNGGDFEITAKDATGTNRNGGSVLLVTGDSTGTGTEGRVEVQGRLSQFKGADVASANDVTLPQGNFFDVTGTTTINAIRSRGWTAGAVVTLQFDAATTVKHNTAGGAGHASLLLAGSVDTVTAAGDTLTLVYDGTTWREAGRSTVAASPHANRVATTAPTGSWTTNSTYTGWIERHGNMAHVVVNLSLAGAPDTATLTINMVNSLVVNEALLPAGNPHVGELLVQDAGTGVRGGTVRWDSTGDKFICESAATSNLYANVTQAAPQVFASGDTVLIDVWVPITGW